MGPPTRDKQLSKALIEAAEKLLKLKLKPQSSTDATTLSLLNEMESLLAPVDPALSVRKKALARLKEALVSADLLRNPDSDVRVSVVSCLTKIMEVAALKAPFTHGQRKDIFQAIIEAFKILADASSRSYKKAEVVLETFSKPNSSLAMLALEYDDLVLEMFQRFLEIIRLPRDHSPLVLLSMETIMITVINKIKKVPMGLLDILLTTVKKESQSPAAVVLVENVLRRCTRNLQSCIMKALKSSGTSLDMYFPVVSSKCQSEFANTQAHNDVKPKENEADEKMSEGQVVPIESLEDKLNLGLSCKENRSKGTAGGGTRGANGDDKVITANEGLSESTDAETANSVMNPEEGYSLKTSLCKKVQEKILGVGSKPEDDIKTGKSSKKEKAHNGVAKTSAKKPPAETKMVKPSEKNSVHSDAKKKNSEGASMDTPIPRSPKGKKKDSRATKNSEQTPNSHPKRKRTAGEEVESNTNELGEELVGKTVDVCSPLNERKAKKRKIGSKNEQPNSSPEVRSSVQTMKNKDSVADSIKQAKKTKGALKAVSNEPEKTTSSIRQSEFANTQAHNVVKPKENEADEKMSEGQVVPIESLEERLDKLGFKIIPMGRDGNCLFRALCHQFYGNQKFHGDIRRKIVEYMQANRELFEKSVDYLDHESYEAYCVRMSQDGTWGDHIQLQAAANITHTGIRVYRDYSRSNEIMPKLPNGRMINLSYHNGNHYNSVCPKDEDAIHQKTKVWWDYENAEIPAGMDHELALDWIVKKLEEYEFGQVELKLVVGYHDSPLPKFLSNIPIIFANKCTRSKKIVTKGNQAADVQIKDMLEEMYADETPTQLENHVFISGDCGYRDHITNLIGAGHRVMMISTGNLKDSRVLLQLKWSKVFGQPEVPIIKSLKESKQAAAKKARSRTHKKDLHKKSLEARQNVIANAKDENVKIPMCISLLHCGSVQFVLELVHHVQVPRITNINDICVSIHAPVAVDGEISRDVQEELARRLGRPLSTFTFQRVFGNRWNVVVKKKQVKKKQDVTCREVYVQLVSAIRPLI